VISCKSYDPEDLPPSFDKKNPDATKDFSEVQSIHIYPIPAKDYIHIELDNIDSKEIKLELFDNKGQKVYLSTRFERFEDKFITFYLKGLKTGIYYLKIYNNKTNIIKKIIKK